MKHTIRLAGFALTLIAAISACGDDSDDSGGSSQTANATGGPCQEVLLPLQVLPEGYAVDAIPGGSSSLRGCFTADGEKRLSRVDRQPGPTCSGVEDAPCLAMGSGSSTPCTHACLADDDCGASEACLCLMGVPRTQLAISPEGTANKCIPAECTGPQDCDGWACGYSHQGCRGNESFHCRGPNDDCETQEDCAGLSCLYSDQKGKWVCMTPGACQ